MLLSYEEFAQEARRFVQQLRPSKEHATVLALYGDLGAGKTTFTQLLARTLGIEEDVTSPTFVIQKRYPLSAQGFTQLIHVDAYRLEDAGQLRVLGWDELMEDPENLIVIEWPEKVVGALDGSEHPLTFTYIDEGTRSIAYGDPLDATSEKE